MKKLLFLSVTAISLLAACNNEKMSKQKQAQLEKQAADTANYTTIQWIDSVKNFGTIKQGEKVEVTFKFKNSGDKPLVLVRVQAGCGCTTSDYTKEPVAPGAEGYVTGIFNSANQMGEVHKNISVFSNTKNGVEHRLEFAGSVLVDEKKPATENQH